MTVSKAATNVVTLDNLPGSTGSSLVGFLQSGSGAVSRTVQAKAREIVSLTDFGADGTAANDGTAWTNALATGASVFVPDGTWLVNAAKTISTQGQGIYGVGYLQSEIRRSTDSTFVMFNVTSTSGNDFRDVRFNEVSGYPTFSNTGSYVDLPIGGGTDINFSRCWFHHGWQHVRCLSGTSNITFEGCIFEASRKGAIDAVSSGRNNVVGCTFWKNSADNSNASDRGYAISLSKDAAYAFGSYNWNIVGNYFAENVYGPFILSNTSEGLQIVGNFFEIASQVDNGQKSDIELTADTRVSIVGNASNSVVNSYVAGERGSKYCVDVASSCTAIAIVGNNFEAGVTGTINDSGNVCTIIGNPGVTDSVLTGIKVGNAAQSGATVFDWYEEASLTMGVEINSSATGITFGTRTGSVTRVGNRVDFRASVTLTSKGVSVGAVRLTGLTGSFLPGTAKASFGSGYITNTSSITTPIFFQINGNDGYVYPLHTVSTNVLDSNIADNSLIELSGTFFV